MPPPIPTQTASLTLRLAPWEIEHHHGDQYPADQTFELVTQCYPGVRGATKEPIKCQVIDKEWTPEGEAWTVEVEGDATDIIYVRMATGGGLEI